MGSSSESVILESTEVVAYFMSRKIARREFLKQGALGAAAVLSTEDLKAGGGETPQPARPGQQSPERPAHQQRAHPGSLKPVP